MGGSESRCCTDTPQKTSKYEKRSATDCSLASESLMQRTRVLHDDPRSPSCDVVRTPIEVPVMNESSVRNRHVNENTHSTKTKELHELSPGCRTPLSSKNGNFDAGTEKFSYASLVHPNQPAILDPRSPSQGIVRTPLFEEAAFAVGNTEQKTASLIHETPKKLQGLSNEGFSSDSETDPRSPTQKVDRTPIAKLDKPKYETDVTAARNLHDPRSPTTEVSRTPLGALFTGHRELRRTVLMTNALMAKPLTKKVIEFGKTSTEKEKEVQSEESNDQEAPEVEDEIPAILCCNLDVLNNSCSSSMVASIGSEVDCISFDESSDVSMTNEYGEDTDDEKMIESLLQSMNTEPRNQNDCVNTLQSAVETNTASSSVDFLNAKGDNHIPKKQLHQKPQPDRIDDDVLQETESSAKSTSHVVLPIIHTATEDEPELAEKMEDIVHVGTCNLPALNTEFATVEPVSTDPLSVVLPENNITQVKDAVSLDNEIPTLHSQSVQANELQQIKHTASIDNQISTSNVQNTQADESDKKSSENLEETCDNDTVQQSYDDSTEAFKILGDTDHANSDDKTAAQQLDAESGISLGENVDDSDIQSQIAKEIDASEKFEISEPLKMKFNHNMGDEKQVKEVKINDTKPDNTECVDNVKADENSPELESEKVGLVVSGDHKTRKQVENDKQVPHDQIQEEKDTDTMNNTGPLLKAGSDIPCHEKMEKKQERKQNHSEAGIDDDKQPVKTADEKSKDKVDSLKAVRKPSRRLRPPSKIASTRRSSKTDIEDAPSHGSLSVSNKKRQIKMRSFSTDDSSPSVGHGNHQRMIKQISNSSQKSESKLPTQVRSPLAVLTNEINSVKPEGKSQFAYSPAKLYSTTSNSKLPRYHGTPPLAGHRSLSVSFSGKSSKKLNSPQRSRSGQRSLSYGKEN